MPSVESYALTEAPTAFFLRRRTLLSPERECLLILILLRLDAHKRDRDNSPRFSALFQMLGKLCKFITELGPVTCIVISLND